MEIGEFCGLSSEVFKRTVVPLDQGRRGDMEEVAKHEAALDEAFHCVCSSVPQKSPSIIVRKVGTAFAIPNRENLSF